MALTDGLVAYWRLNEALGSRYDVHGEYNLSQVGSVPGVDTPGRIGRSSDWTDADSANRLERIIEATDDEAFTMGDGTAGFNYTWMLWLYLVDWPPTDAYALFRTHLLGVRVNSAGNLNVTWYRGDTTTSIGSVTSTGGLPTGQWFCVFVIRSAVYIHRVGQAVTTLSASISPASNGNSECKLLVGLNDYATVATGLYPFQDYIDEVGFWNRTLTSDERTSLFNGGNGLAYPFAPSGGPQAFVY